MYKVQVRKFTLRFWQALYCLLVWTPWRVLGGVEHFSPVSHGVQYKDTGHVLRADLFIDLQPAYALVLHEPWEV